MKRSVFFKSIFGVMILFYLSGCLTSTLVLNDNSEVILSYNDKKIEAKGELLKRNFLTFSNIDIDQHVLRFKNNRILVFESTDVSPYYQYNFSTRHSIEMIFDAKYASIIYRRNNLYVLQIVLKNDKVINAFVQQSDDQKLSMIYGLGKKEFANIIDSIKEPDADIGKIREDNILLFNDPKTAIRTKWTVKLINIDSLLRTSDSTRML